MYDFACQNCSASLIHRSWKLRCQIGKAYGLSIPIRWDEPPLIICIVFSIVVSSLGVSRMCKCSGISANACKL